MNQILYNSYNQKLNFNMDNNQGIYKTYSNTITPKTSNVYQFNTKHPPTLFYSFCNTYIFF